MKFISKQALAILTVCFISLSAVAEKASSPADQKSAAGNNAGRLYGKVVETMDSGGYSYVLISDGKKKHWAAGPQVALKKGDMVGFEGNMPFSNFESKTLKRKFETIYFVNRFITDKPGQQVPAAASNSTAAAANPHAGAGNTSSNKVIKGIKKAKGGKTVAEVFKQKKKLAGKTIHVRGKVTKYSAMIMNKNWLHIQDSSGQKDLVVTTDQEVKVGDLVLVKGVVTLDQNLGSGYVYEVIVEKAKISVE